MNDNQNKQLSDWIEGVVKGLKTKRIASEQDVDECVWFSPVLGRPQGLLAILGYKLVNVKDHKSNDCEVGSGLKPDFVVKVKSKSALVIEDKKPLKALSDRLKSTQIWDYMDKEGSPLGLLFDSKEAILVVNPKLEVLKKFQDLVGIAVLKASINDADSMMVLLEHIKFKETWEEYREVAEILGQKKLDENKARKREVEKRKKTNERRKAIDAVIHAIKNDPPDWLLEAIAEKDENLKNLSKVLINEIHDAWVGNKSISITKDRYDVIGKANGKTFTATFDLSQRKILFEKEWLSPSQAGLKAMRTVQPETTGPNGWTFWSYEDTEKGKWLPIDNLRKSGEKD